MAAPFQDLDFEQATVHFEPGFPDDDQGAPVVASAAFPGWVAAYDGAPLNEVQGLAVGLDQTQIALIFPDTQSEPTVDGAPQGLFAAYLSGDANGPPGYPKAASLSQTGDIPANAVSIQFLIGSLYPGQTGSNPLFSVNGTTVPVYPIRPSGSSELWGGDVAVYAGTTATITFTAAGVSSTSPGGEDVYDLDAISFSNQPVPEPFTSASMILWCGASLLRRDRRTSSLHQAA